MFVRQRTRKSLHQAIKISEPLEQRLLLAARTWDGGPTGNGTNWSTAANWVDDIAPVAGDTVELGATGSSPTTSIATPVDVASINTSRTIQLNGGTISNASISGTGSIVSATGTFGGVTLGINATMANAASLTITNGLTLANNATITLNGTSTNTDVTLSGAQIIGGTGSFVLAGNGFSRLVLGANVTFGPNVTTRGRGTITESAITTLTNQGTLLADVNVQNLTVATSNFTNTGTLSASSNGFLVLQTAISVGGLGTINKIGAGSVRLTGTLNNTGNTLTLSGASQSLVLDAGGTISGGTINLTNNANISAGGGTLSGITLGAGDIVVQGSRTLAVSNGITLLSGARIVVGFLSTLNFPTTQTINGGPGGTGGEIVLQFVGVGQVSILRVAPSTTLTIGAGVTVRGRGGINNDLSPTPTVINNGTIHAEGHFGLSMFLTNNGTVMTTADGFFDMNVGRNNNIVGGTLTGGTWRHLGGTFELGGTVTTNNAVIETAGMPIGLENLANNIGTLTFINPFGRTITPSGGTFTNSGTMRILNGANSSLLEINGAFTQTSSGSLHVEMAGPSSHQYGRIEASGLVTLNGALSASLTNGYDPAPFTDFAVVTGVSRIGTFGSFSGGTTPSGHTLDDRYDDEETTAFITVLPSWLTMSNGASYSFASNTLTIHAGSFTVTGDPNTSNPGMNIVVNGTSNLAFSAAAARIGALTLNGTSTATLSAGSNRVLVITDISLASGAKLDLNDNDLIVDYTDPSPRGTV